MAAAYRAYEKRIRDKKHNSLTTNYTNYTKNRMKNFVFFVPFVDEKLS